MNTFTQPDTTAHPPAPSPLEQAITTVIKVTDQLAPRSLQTHLGPSEIGDPCLRRLAYKLHDHTPTNTDTDPWFAIVGTSVHAWLADAFGRQNIILGRRRWLVEQRVTIRPGLGGSCDLYDTDTDTVIDHKVIGSTSMADYRRDGPREQYVIQAHLYGLGWENTGRVPKRVALNFLPRNGYLASTWVWEAPYDRDVAQRALDRLDGLIQVIGAVEPERHGHVGWAAIPPSASHACTYCPFYSPFSRDLTVGCPGNTATKNAA